MKYEPVFGDQSLFDGAPEDAEYVAIDGTRNQLIFYKDMAVGDHYSFFDRNSSHWSINDGRPCYSINSMRRIIQEPKRWTVEDKKAGRLPEVGAEVQFNFYQSAVVRQGIIKYIDEQVALIQTEDIIRPFCYETCKVVFTPIETPEEKADRLRNEWINEAINVVQKSHLNGYESIYDALLTGALSVPAKGGE